MLGTELYSLLPKGAMVGGAQKCSKFAPVFTAILFQTLRCFKFLSFPGLDCLALST